MKAQDQDRDQLHLLRARAEQELRRALRDSDLSSRDRVIYELEVHEVELRMQNQALCESQVALTAARDEYQELFERAPIAYAVMALDSTMQQVNLAACDLFESARDGLVGAKLATFIDGAHVERFSQHLRAATAGEDRLSCELTLLLPSGTMREVRLESSRSPHNARQLKTALIDLTELRQLERNLERSRRLEAIGTFASGVAHDFSNLLGVVNGSSELALDQLERGESARPTIERIRRAAMGGKDVVRQLLRFATGPDNDSRGLYDMDATLKGAEQLVRQMAGPKTRVRMRLGAPGAVVCLDLGGPEEILLNLAANAEHAMPNGGELMIETHKVVANVALDPRLPPQAYALLSVTDNGVGMDEQTQARAFEPFFTTKSAGHGTGLGLAMVYGIVKRAGGHIQLTSELRKGTTFRIYLPLCSEGEAEG